MLQTDTTSQAVVRQEWVTILGVDYLHLVLEDGSDQYLTSHGLPFALNLLPHNYWSDKEWFDTHHQRLPGSSTLYRIRTKKVNGRQSGKVGAG